MKKFLLLSMSALGMPLSFSTFRKNSGSFLADPPVTEPLIPTLTADKLQFRWKIDKYLHNLHVAGVDDKISLSPDPMDRILFTTGGLVLFKLQYIDYEKHYSINQDGQIIVEETVYEVKKMTSNELVLYNKTFFHGVDTYAEETIALYK